MNEPQAVPSSLKRSKRVATIALITAVVTWLLLMVVAKFVPTDKVWIIHILMLSAEAGVVGGLAVSRHGRDLLPAQGRVAVQPALRIRQPAMDPLVGWQDLRGDRVAGPAHGQGDLQDGGEEVAR